MVADRIAIIDQGRLLKVGAVDELSHSPVVCEIGSISTELISALKSFDSFLTVRDKTVELSYIADEDLPDIAKTIITHKGLLYGMKRKESILEDLFINTIKGDK